VLSFENSKKIAQSLIFLAAVFFFQEARVSGGGSIVVTRESIHSGDNLNRFFSKFESERPIFVSTLE
jgi:hypothetical protein